MDMLIASEESTLRGTVGQANATIQAFDFNPTEEGDIIRIIISQQTLKVPVFLSWGEAGAAPDPASPGGPGLANGSIGYPLVLSDTGASVFNIYVGKKISQVKLLNSSGEVLGYTTVSLANLPRHLGSGS